jgi:hypothetical protein
MFIFSRNLALAFVVAAALCAGARTAHAQAAPLSYWTPGWPLGFGGTADADQVANSYANFPSFTATDARGFTYSRYNFGDGWFVGNVRGTTGLGGLGQAAAFGNFGSLTTEGTQFGYTFKNNGLPISVYGGLNTLKYNNGIANPFTQFDSQANAASGYSAQAGIEIQPTSNLSLSFGASFTQQPGDINSLVLPGASPYGPRR